MKKTMLSLGVFALLGLSTQVLGQVTSTTPSEPLKDHAVGINTDKPYATLDVDGNARLRVIREANLEKATVNQILVVDKDGNIHRIPISDATLADLVKDTPAAGGGTGPSTPGGGAGTTGGSVTYAGPTYVTVNQSSSNPNGLDNTSVKGKSLRNYDGSDVPDYNENDYMIVLTNEDVNGNLQLPSAKANPGRIIYLINGTISPLGFSATGTGVEDTYPFNFGTIATRSGVPFVSTGKTWYVIGR
ncbi:hypothetical protein MWN41_11505 [Ornithobacterium rhinotracheale]|uniref:hypothetical protein n=1 Tax=Ornithobacterium rhinotracheale TaxID=28251 RepID=UPI001FF3D4B1|nr:hypothetical protein [Ornithobacterium rhinotracheale]MCK0203639.1 hypothetical protein [Ornithobacterium rhinotracheale]